MKSLNHLICNSIKISLRFSKTLIFVNSIDHAQLLRRDFISLSKICSKCSMRNPKKRIYFRIKTTCLFKHSQIKCKSSSISNLQSIKSRRLVKTRKARIRRVWISTCLRNQFALFSAEFCLRNWSNYHTNCQMFSVIWSFRVRIRLQKSFFSFLYFFVFSRFFFLFWQSFRSCQLRQKTALTSTNKLFRPLIVPFNKNSAFVASRRSWKKTRNRMLEYSVTKHLHEQMFCIHVLLNESYTSTIACVQVSIR